MFDNPHDFPRKRPPVDIGCYRGPGISRDPRISYAAEILGALQLEESPSMSEVSPVIGNVEGLPSSKCGP